MAMTAEELAGHMKREVDKILDCCSYLYELHSVILSATPISEGGDGRNYRTTHLIHRKGDRDRFVQTWSGRHDDAKTSQEAPSRHISVRAFDRDLLRKNLIQSRFYKDQITYNLSPLTDLESFDRILNPPTRPDTRSLNGSARQPRGDIYDGSLSSDHFFEAVAFVPTRGGTTRWDEVMWEDTTEVTDLGEGKYEVKGFYNRPPQEFAARAKVSLVSAELILRQSGFRIVVDSRKSYRVIEAEAECQFSKHFPTPLELKDLEFDHDPKTGIWYPTKFTHIIHKCQINHFELKEISFEQFPDNVFSDIWVDGQEVYEEETKDHYYLNPRFEKKLEVLWENMLVRVGLSNDPLRPFPRNLPGHLMLGEDQLQGFIRPILAFPLILAITTIILMGLHRMRKRRTRRLSPHS